MAVRDARKTREELVAAAAEAFEEDGYWGTDTNRIARRAGYSPGTFYKHFDDKRSIFLAAYERWVDAEWEAIGFEVAAGRDPLRRIVDVVVEHHVRWAGFRRSLRALAATDAEVRAFRADRQAKQLEDLRSLLREVGAARVTKTDCLFTLLLFERISDAIADGEGKAMGVSESALRRRLLDQLESLAHGTT